MFAGPLEPEIQARYLARLGLTAQEPSAGALRILVGRQAERVPYETLWIQSGELWGIDPAVSARRIATTSRGGYCYHLNGALGLLLSSLGYDVHGHVGGVHGPAGPTPDEVGNHLVLTVRGLPAEDNPSGTWYVDTGLGDALHDPLPLVAGGYVQGPFRLTLEQTGTGWLLIHDPRGGFRGMHWTPDEARLADFGARHVQLSTSPDSGFVQVPMAERRDATGVDVVRGLIRSRISSGGRTDEQIRGESEYFELLADVLGLRFDASPAGTRERLWAAAVGAHRAWSAGQA